MSFNLVELVLCMVISALVFLGAIVPTTQALVRYQKTEASFTDSTVQNLAAVRVEQVAAGIWRSGSPPEGCGPLNEATAAQLGVGEWTLRFSGGRLEQKRTGGSFAPLTGKLDSGAFEYLLESGKWVSSVDKADLASVESLRYAWKDAASGRKCSGVVVPADRPLGDQVLELPAPDESGKPYDRAAYTRKYKLELGTWGS